jgi:hypothetical protein
MQNEIAVLGESSQAFAAHNMDDDNNDAHVTIALQFLDRGCQPRAPTRLRVARSRPGPCHAEAENKSMAVFFTYFTR